LERFDSEKEGRRRGGEERRKREKLLPILERERELEMRYFWVKTN
jgi:hypothetical protein